MSEINFPVRFIADEHFIREIIADKSAAAKILLQLSHIHRNSKQYSLCHNLMFDECFKKSISDKQVRGQAILGAFHPEPSPDFVKSEDDFESRLIKYAINIATKRPYNVIILTSKAQATKYIGNAHYKNDNVQKGVIITAGEEAVKFIEIMSAYED